MESVFSPGKCIFHVKRKSDGKEQTVVMEWWGYSDNEEREYRFSVSIKEEDNLVGFASYERSDFINWSNSELIKLINFEICKV